MSNIEILVHQINREFVPQFEEKLRAALNEQDKDWLVEQIVRLTLDKHSLQEMDRRHVQEAKARKRALRVERLKDLCLDREKLIEFLRRYESFDRERLIAEGLLSKDAPAKGLALIGPDFRSPEGEAVLTYAKDVLFGLLFGDESMNTRFEREQQELLTLTVPRDKVEALDFMKATTELSAVGTWQDPESVSNDARADNVLLEVEYGEITGELVGNGIVRALSLINNLEVNEQILYARMVNVEESTLIE